MWELYQRCKILGGRPSQHLAVPPLQNDWAAYQFDNAVLFVGITVENALGERENRGSEDRPDWQPKYKLNQLLEPDFRLPRPDTQDAAQGKAVGAALKALVGKQRPKPSAAGTLPSLVQQWAAGQEAKPQ